MTDIQSDLSAVISSAVTAHMASGAVDEIVRNQTEKMVIEAVQTAMRTYSDNGRLIEKAVADALRVDRLDLPSYGATVSAMVQTLVEKNVSDLIAGRLSEDVEELLNLAPKTVKLSEIAEYMMQIRLDRERDHGELITVVVKSHTWQMGNGCHLYLDYNAGAVAAHDCSVRLHISSEGRILSAQLDGSCIKSTTFLGRQYRLHQRVLAYYAAGTIIEIDEDEVVTYHDYD